MQKGKNGVQYEPKKVISWRHSYDDWFENERLTDKEESVDLSDISQLEDDEEVKEGKGLENLTLNKLLTRLPMLLPPIKAGNNSCKLKNEIRQIYILY